MPGPFRGSARLGGLLTRSVGLKVLSLRILLRTRAKRGAAPAGVAGARANRSGPLYSLVRRRPPVEVPGWVPSEAQVEEAFLRPRSSAEGPDGVS